MQAGLGNISLSMPIDMTHLEVIHLSFSHTPSPQAAHTKLKNLLQIYNTDLHFRSRAAYPKMKTITGGWLLYKADSIKDVIKTHP